MKETLEPWTITERVRVLPNDGSVECALHAYHRPEVASFDEHHIVPLSAGGSDSDDNIAVVCPTGHRNVHTLLRLFVRIGPQNVDRRSWGYETWNMAVAGYNGGDIS